MALEEAQSKWIYRFTAGAVPLPQPAGGAPAGTPEEQRQARWQQLLEELRLRQGRERVEEQALKEVMVAKAIAVLQAEKETMRKALDLKVTTRDAKGKETQQNVRDEKGRQQKAFDAAEANTLTEVPEGLCEAGKAYALLVEQSDLLANARVERSRIDKKSETIVFEREKLFTDDEIQEELYTPLVRELVVPETLIVGKFSATQKMIDGSNKYYLDECKTSGKSIDSGGVEFAKGAINVASAVTSSVLAGLAPVKAGQEGMAASGTIGKQQAATATAMTQGIAALLSGTVDAVDQIKKARKSGEFSVSGYRTVMDSVTLGLGKIVAGATGNMNLGLTITDSLNAAVAGSALVPELVKWQKNGGPPPVASMIELIGKSIASGFSAKSDQTSDSATSTAWAQAGSAVGAAFTTAAKAQEKHLLDSIKKGDWNAVFEVVATAGVEAGKAVPAAVQFAAQYNAIDGVDASNPNQTDQDKAERQFQEQQRLVTAVEGLGANVDKLGGGVSKVGENTNMKGKPLAASEKQLAEIEKKFAEYQKAKDAKKAQSIELDEMQEMLDAERKRFQDSLLCLGSTEPSDAEYKSIATLVAQLERDRAIWNGLNAMFGAGLGLASSVASASTVAASVVPGLNAAGQMVKFIANLKAAADRLSAFLDWKESRKDAASAVSPYATSIENFCANQGSQFTHYTVQAAANIIQALLAVGELSPYAPAFKAAGGAVAAAAATEELVYKFMKQQALRSAWNATKEALEPKNKGNRKMALLVREINPTLAKYTIAYGALIERSPIAITAMNRIGLDRETLARAGDAVKDVKNYLDKLYVDDGAVVGKLDVKPGQTAVPTPALTSRAWAMTVLLWTEKDRMATPNPPDIVANLALAERQLKARNAGRNTPATEKELETLLATLGRLERALLDFDPRTQSNTEMESARKVADQYVDLVYATTRAVSLDLETVRAAAATV